jgi:hypothetical protein
MIAYPPCITDFDWKDLHGKILKIAVAEANPECLEFYTQVYGMDEKGTFWLLAEIPFNQERKPNEKKTKKNKKTQKLRNPK